MSLRSKIPETDVNRGRLLGETRIAYTLIETARIRCEALMTGTANDPTLRAIHHELGLAGYHASSDFASELRVRSLAEAHRRCDLAAIKDPRQTLRAISDDVLTACDAISYVLLHNPDAELQDAHTYALAAATLMDAQVSEAKAA